MGKHILYTLSKSYPGLYLSIKEGISKTEEYKDLCLRGKESPFALDFCFDENDVSTIEWE